MGCRVRVFHLLGHLGTAEDPLLHQGGGSLLARVITCTKGAASPHSWAEATIMAGTNQGDMVLSWRLPWGCWWCQPSTPEPGSSPVPCHGGDSAHPSCKCCSGPSLMDWVSGAHLPLLCAAFPGGTGRQGWCRRLSFMLVITALSLSLPYIC